MAQSVHRPETDSWHALEVAALEKALDTGEAGLSQQRVQARLEEYGPNQVEETPPKNRLVILLGQFRSPLIYILLAAAVVTALLGEYIDTGVILVILGLNALIGFVQEYRAEVSVRALMKLVSPRAHVLRKGREWEVDSRQLVPGDVVLLESGSRVPADLRLVGAQALSIDESLLTGESVPAHKETQVLGASTPLADRRNMAYAGSVVSSGRGRGYVVATGNATGLGRIAGSIREEAPAATPLQERMGRFGRLVGGVVGGSSVLAFLIGILLGRSPAEMFMLAVALAVAAVPEGLPVVLTITLAVGVRRMASRNAILRRLPAVETLGSTSVIGSDKTGTLTENQMSVQQVWAGGQRFQLGREAGEALAEHHPLYLTLLTGVITNEAEVYLEEGRYESRGDPTEVALLLAAEKMGLRHELLRSRYAAFAEIPFESERQYSASVRERAGERWLFVKGAPERVVGMCRAVQGEAGPGPLDVPALLEAAHRMAGEGLRVLGMAYARQPAGTPHPDAVHEPEGLTFVGLVGMMDPPREGVRESVAACCQAGIRVLMITGDHAATARSIAKELGLLEEGGEVMTGTELERMDGPALDARVGKVAVFARVAPEQKLRVVQALQRGGEVVAVTGDGVNDAPALKAADIGVAMGRGGTDVAREAADMVLTDDNFVSIRAAVEEGRVTFDNLRKATFFLISTGAATVLTLLASLVLDWPLPFLPAQLLWLNLVTNGLQDVALAFEPGDKDVLERPPRPRTEGILSPLLWERTVLAGLVMMAGTLGMFHWELARSGSLAAAQTMALTVMVVFQSFQVGNARSETQSVFLRSPFSNPFLLIATSAALAVHVGALFFGPTQLVLRVVPLADLEAWIRLVLVALTLVVAMELHKVVRRPRRPASPPGTWPARPSSPAPSQVARPLGQQSAAEHHRDPARG